MRALREGRTDGWHGPQCGVRYRRRKAGNPITDCKYETGTIIANEV
jgi:hypothetical protein